MKANNLKPCPFCGYETRQRFIKQHMLDTGIMFFYCKNPECNAVTSFKQPFTETTKLFNQRHKK